MACKYWWVASDVTGYISLLQTPPSTSYLIILAFTDDSCLDTLFHEGVQNDDLSSSVHLLISSICLLWNTAHSGKLKKKKVAISYYLKISTEERVSALGVWFFSIIMNSDFYVFDVLQFTAIIFLVCKLS